MADDHRRAAAVNLEEPFRARARPVECKGHYRALRTGVENLQIIHPVPLILHVVGPGSLKGFPDISQAAEVAIVETEKRFRMNHRCNPVEVVGFLRAFEGVEELNEL